MAKHHTLRFNLEHRGTFNSIRTGKKRVETRAATIRYKNIESRDRITFVCGAVRFSRTVSKASFFRTPAALLKKYAPQDIRPGVTSKKEMIAIWHSFPNYKEKIAKYGLVALELQQPVKKPRVRAR